MADTEEPRRRWDTDERFVGVADATMFAAAVDELAVLARRPGWVAEEPEVYLEPHLRGASPGGLRLLDCTAGQDGVLNVVAEHARGDGWREIRCGAWTLLGTVAEPAANVRERRDGDSVVFEVITGNPDGAFASHGHTIRLRVQPSA